MTNQSKLELEVFYIILLPLLFISLGKSRTNSPCYLTGFRTSSCHGIPLGVIQARKRMMNSSIVTAFLSNKQISRDSFWKVMGVIVGDSHCASCK